MSAASSETVDAITARLNGKLFGMREAIGFAFNLPEIPGLGATSGVEANLQDRGGLPVQDFATQVQAFTAGGEPAAVGPGRERDLPRQRAAAVSWTWTARRRRRAACALGDVFGTLQALLSTLYVNDFNLYGKTYRVQIEAQAPFRQRPQDIGQLVRARHERRDDPDLDAHASGVPQRDPTLITRFNGFTSALHHGRAEAGAQLRRDDGRARRTWCAPSSPRRGSRIAYSGQSYQERASSGAAGTVFALGLVLVFLVLAAQYESWSLPFAVLLGVPFGVLGAFLGIWLRGQPNDIYVQVGLLTVVGLAAKNAILIVEFATELRAQGLSIKDAALEAARERLRPILMTSFAFILRRVAAAGGRRCRRGEPPLHRHHRLRRHAGRDVYRDLLHPALLLDHPEPRRAGQGAGGMKARVGVVAALIVLAACPVGPNYEPQPPVPPSTRWARRAGPTRSRNSTTRSPPRAPPIHRPPRTWLRRTRCWRRRSRTSPGSTS